MGKRWMVGLAAVSLAAPVAQATQYLVDESHAFVGVTVEHFASSHLRGMFNEVSGSMTFDPAEPSKTQARIVIKTDSFSAGFVGRSDAVKSEQFLDAAKYPEIVFESTSVEQKGDGYAVKGTLTIRGVTRPVSFPLIVNGPRKDPFGLQRIGFEGSVTVNRLDFGTPFDRKFEDGAPWVGHDVVIEFSVEATPAPED